MATADRLEEFERLVGDLSRSLSDSATDELDGVIVEGLRELALHLGLQRAFLGRLRADGLVYSDHFWLHADLKQEQTEFYRVFDPASFPIVGSFVGGEIVAIRSPEEVPASSAERRYMEQTGLVSTLFVPGAVAGKVVGFLVLDSFSEPRSWPDSLIRRLALPVDLLFGALLRLEAAARIQELSGFERLVADLSAALGAVKPDGLESLIDTCLEKLATLLGAERAFIAQFTDGGDRLVFTNAWAVEGISPRSEIFDLDLVRDLPWVPGQIRRGESIKAGPELTGLPEGAEALRAQLESDGITSGVVVPILVRGRAVGMLGLDTRARPRDYPDALVERLRAVADVIGSTLVRTRAEETIERRLRFEALLAELSRRCVAVGPEELEREIERWLEPIGRAIDVEHVVVGVLSSPNDPATVTVLTWNVGRRVRPLTPEEVPWLVRAIFERGESVPVCSLADLPPEAAIDRGTFESVGIRAFISVPLRCGEQVYGGMSFCSLSRERSWPDDLRTWLGLIGEVLANALARRHTELELHGALGQSRRAEASLREALAENERLRERLQRENIYLRREIEVELGVHRIVGESPALLRVLDEARRAADTDSTVLITGETGTGKELVARLVHEQSNRSDRALVKVNCGTLPETLVESELFGRERGAYTGAMTRQTGRFEVADGATIFLDEIGELPPATQVKLLRVLEGGEFERLGSSKTLEVDVRVIAATNRNLVQDVADGRFRQDLYYRLNVVPLALPPLRERGDDILLLTWHFIQEFSERMAKPIESIERSTLAAFRSYAWPGNIRELKNVIERAMILGRGPVFRAELPSVQARTGRDPAAETDLSLDSAQRRQILKVMKRTGWRVRGAGGAAELLRMKPSTLENRMKKLGVKRPA